MNTKVCGITLALLAAVAMVFSFAAAASFDAEEGDEDDPQPIDYLIGYVFNIPPQMEREPIAGVQVTVWYSMSQPYAHTFTKDDGYFEIKYDPSIQYISFNIDDFTVKGWSSELNKAGDSDLYRLNLIDDHTVDGRHRLYDDSGYTALVSRTIGTMFGTVSSQIGGSTVFIEDATVTLESSTSILTTKTDEFGYYSISCPSGTSYKMTVTASGFVTWTEEGIEPSKESMNISIEEKSHILIFGLDLAHTLELFGLLILLMVAILAVYLIRKPTKVEGLAVINDLPVVTIEEEREEEKDD